MKRKRNLILFLIAAVLLVWVGWYYYNTSAHRDISMNDVLSIQIITQNESYEDLYDDERAGIVKAFNSIKSIRRHNENSLPIAKMGQVIIIKLKTGSEIEIYSGYAVDADVMVKTPDRMYSGKDPELKEFLEEFLY